MDTVVREIAADSVTVSASDLLELLEGASTHADRGKNSLRALSSVEIWGEGGRLFARATDRYRAIVGEIAGDYADLAPSLIALDDIKRVISLAKVSKLYRITLTRVNNLLTVSVSGSAITLELLDDNYPPSFDNLFDKGESSSMEMIAINPLFVADYAKIVGKDQPVKLEFRGAGNPIHIGLKGNAVEWRALLMPMRII
jgi:DNA polymerase III sliding clamp (beta) subunit (PCNA family)